MLSLIAQLLQWIFYSLLFVCFILFYFIFESTDIIPIHIETIAHSNEIPILIVLSVEQTNKDKTTTDETLKHAQTI